MKVSHKGNARVRVIVKCLDAVKIYGNRPMKLLNKINKNNEINIKDLPLKESVPSNSLNSKWSLVVISLIKDIFFLLIDQ